MKFCILSNWEGKEPSKIGHILKEKVLQKCYLSWNVLKRSCSTIHIFIHENHFQKNSADFWHRKLTLKIGFLLFVRGQKELQGILIKKLFDYKLSMGKYLHNINWTELDITIVDTLLCIYRGSRFQGSPKKLSCP